MLSLPPPIYGGSGSLRKISGRGQCLTPKLKHEDISGSMTAGQGGVCRCQGMGAGGIVHAACFWRHFSWEVKAGLTSETPGCLADNFSMTAPRLSLKYNIRQFFSFIFKFLLRNNFRLAKECEAFLRAFHPTSRNVNTTSVTIMKTKKLTMLRSYEQTGQILSSVLLMSLFYPFSAFD